MKYSGTRSLSVQRLFIAAGFGFGLERRMMYPELCFKQFGHCLANRRLIEPGCNGDMGGQAGIIPGYRPDVEIVNARHACHGANGGADGIEIHPMRDALQQDVLGIAQQYPCARQHP